MMQLIPPSCLHGIRGVGRVPWGGGKHWLHQDTAVQENPTWFLATPPNLALGLLLNGVIPGTLRCGQTTQGSCAVGYSDVGLPHLSRLALYGFPHIPKSHCQTLLKPSLQMWLGASPCASKTCWAILFPTIPSPHYSEVDKSWCEAYLKTLVILEAIN